MKARSAIPVLILMMALALVAGCAQYGTSPATPAATATPAPVSSPPRAPTTAAPSATTAAPGTSAVTVTTAATPAPTTTPQTQIITVHISGFQFVPDTLTVLPGTRIMWVNDDDAPHAVAATGNATGLFQSGTLQKGQEFNYTFGDVGTYEYICTIHPSMHGTIVVKQGSPGNVGDVGP